MVCWTITCFSGSNMSFLVIYLVLLFHPWGMGKLLRRQLYITITMNNSNMSKNLSNCYKEHCHLGSWRLNYYFIVGYLSYKLINIMYCPLDEEKLSVWRNLPKRKSFMWKSILIFFCRCVMLVISWLGQALLFQGLMLMSIQFDIVVVRVMLHALVSNLVFEQTAWQELPVHCLNHLWMLIKISTALPLLCRLAFQFFSCTIF